MLRSSSTFIRRRPRVAATAGATQITSWMENPPHHHCYLFSTTTTNKQGGPDPKQKRLARTLYRQLLRWTKTTNSDIPLASFIEPISLAPPQLDQEHLDALNQYKDEGTSSSQKSDNDNDNMIAKAYHLLPPRTSIGEDTLLVAVQNTPELRNLMRSMYRLNAAATTITPEVQKSRVSFAFQTLRTLNELSTSLEELNEQRANHQHRDQVLYRVGQVVQHKQERWRGVIIGWETPDNNSSDDDDGSEKGKPLTSLTTKAYTARDFLQSTRYEVLLDTGDVHMMQATSSFLVTTQTDLQPVTDPRLCRIRSNLLSDHFDKYDIHSHQFVPNELLAYEYPLDHPDAAAAAEQQQNEDASTSCDPKETIQQIQEFAEQLKQHIVLPEDHNQRDELRLLSSFQSRLQTLASGSLKTSSQGMVVHNQHGNVLAPQQEQDIPSVSSACAYLRQILNISLEVRDVLFHRTTSKEAQLKFALGDVVYHKVFGFRGVVVAVDPKPSIDVSRWDGVQHIDNPLEQPFYHVVPDPQDCIEIFGAERGLRYVCEENMEACYKNRSAVSVPRMDADWPRRVGADGRTVFEAPPEVQFKHGMDIGDDNLTEHCLNKIQEEITHWQVQSRDSPDSDNNPYSQLSQPRLLKLLQATESLDDAIGVEETLKEMWKAHPSQVLRNQLDHGISDVLRGKGKEAIDVFKDLATQDQHYAEAWNKIAACEYMLGHMQASLEAAEKALDLVPTHFQAHNGVGLVHFDEGRYELAAESFQTSILLDPWSPVSSKLAACMDMLNKQTDNDKTRSKDSSKDE